MFLYMTVNKFRCGLYFNEMLKKKKKKEKKQRKESTENCQISRTDRCLCVHWEKPNCLQGTGGRSYWTGRR